MQTIRTEGGTCCLCPILWDSVTERQYKVSMFEPSTGHVFITISIYMDRLLGKWLKLSKSVDLPDNFCVLTLYSLFRHVQIIKLHKGSVLIDSSSNALPYVYYDKYLTIVHRRHDLNLAYDVPHCLPFFLLESNRFDLLSDIRCDRPITLLETSKPRIYILSFSNIIRTEKDCAKLLRTYSNNLHHPVWDVRQESFRVKISINLSEYSLIQFQLISRTAFFSDNRIDLPTWLGSSEFPAFVYQDSLLNNF